MIFGSDSDLKTMFNLHYKVNELKNDHTNNWNNNIPNSEIWDVVVALKLVSQVSYSIWNDAFYAFHNFNLFSHYCGAVKQVFECK